jgi:hypothetical protein
MVVPNALVSQASYAPFPSAAATVVAPETATAMKPVFPEPAEVFTRLAPIEMITELPVVNVTDGPVVVRSV